MSRWNGRTNGWWTIARAVAFAVVGALALAVPAAGDTHKSQWGVTGPHFLNDSEEYPGANCRYAEVDPDVYLESIRVFAPTVLARDRTSGNDARTVGWRILVQRYGIFDSEPAWEPFASSSFRYAIATDERAASFKARRFYFEPMGVHDDQYRVLVVMVWLKPGSSEVEGRARHLVDFHRHPNAASEPSTGPSCPGGLIV